MPGVLTEAITMMTNILQIGVKVACSVSNIKCRTGIYNQVNLAKTQISLKPYHPTFHKMQSLPFFPDMCLEEEIYDAVYMLYRDSA